MFFAENMAIFCVITSAKISKKPAIKGVMQNDASFNFQEETV